MKVGRQRSLCDTCYRVINEISPVQAQCERCNTDMLGVRELYIEIILKHPELASCTMPELFRRMWEKVKSGADYPGFKKPA